MLRLVATQLKLFAKALAKLGGLGTIFVGVTNEDHMELEAATHIVS